MRREEQLMLKITVGDEQSVSARLHAPKRAKACLVLAHGAGAGMDHPFMAAVADGLGERNVATLRFQFPFMEQGSRRPDRPPLAHATVRAAVAKAAHLLPSLPLYAGGKSFGGRMTSQAQAEAPMPGVVGLVFVGFPLHPAKKPSIQRAAHLAQVRVPMLFFQGTRDALAEAPLIASMIADLGRPALLKTIEGADHAFHVPKRSGRSDADVLAEMLDDIAAWIEQR